MTDDKSKSYYPDFEYDRMLQEDYNRGMFSPRKRVKHKRTCLVFLKLNPPEKDWVLSLTRD